LVLLSCCDAQVSRLEQEGQQMQATLSQNQQVIKSLERRVAGLESEMHDHQQRVGAPARLSGGPHAVVCRK
jgi:predicted RNase H-like nuclease (RuvC/YqgF family)